MLATRCDELTDRTSQRADESPGRAGGRPRPGERALDPTSAAHR